MRLLDGSDLADFFFNYLLALNGGPTGRYRFFITNTEDDMMKRDIVVPKVHKATLHKYGQTCLNVCASINENSVSTIQYNKRT